jgi:hypothetical protein
MGQGPAPGLGQKQQQARSDQCQKRDEGQGVAKAQPGREQPNQLQADRPSGGGRDGADRL